MLCMTNARKLLQGYVGTLHRKAARSIETVKSRSEDILRRVLVATNRIALKCCCCF